MIICVPKDQPTIQDAVYYAGPGDTILVAPGVYTETVYIPEDKANLLIKGSGKCTVLRAPVAGVSIAGFFNDDNNGLQIRDLTIENFLVGIVDFAGSANTFANLCLKDNIGAGILLIFDKNTAIRETRITGSLIAVGNVVSKDTLVLESELEHNALGQIDLLTGGTLMVRTEVEENHLGGLLSILGLRGRYAENEFEDNGPVLGGILGILDFANVYERNLIACNGPAGFISAVSDEDILRRNTITRNDGPGVLLIFDYSAIVEYNCIDRNLGPGVELFYTFYSTIRFNELECNRGSNLVISGEGNVIDGNQTRGF